MLCRSLAFASYRLEFVQKYYRLCQSMLHLSVVLYKSLSPVKKIELERFSVWRDLLSILIGHINKNIIFVKYLTNQVFYK